MSGKEGPETKLKKEFRAFMKELGAYNLALVHMGYGKRGVDDYFCLRGKFIAAEAKAPGKYKHPWHGCTGPQKTTLKEVHAAGGVAIAYDNLEEAKAIIREIL